jgi:hypothetical protein
LDRGKGLKPLALCGILGGAVDDQPNSGQTPTSFYTVAEAAQILGINPEAVRSRIKRGTLASVKEGGTVYVLLDADQTRSNTGPMGDQTLVESLQDQIGYLREQLNQANERDRENRRIIAALTSRIPQIEAPPTDASEEPSEEAAEEPERPWWRRWFGA